MKKVDISKITLIAIMVLMTAISSNINWGKERWKGIVEADGKGYYAYLPAVFIYHDLNFGFFDHIEKEKYYNPNRYYDYRANSGTGQLINKYYSGTAVAELPFFVMAHSLTIATNGDADGYSKYYMIFINIAALFYLFLGLFYLRKTLIAYAIPRWAISATLVAAVFATNLFVYTVVDTGLSHVFSFGFISAFIYFTKRYFNTPKAKSLPVLALLLGIIVLIRPVNLLIILSWPFLAGSLKSVKEGLKFAIIHYKNLIFSAAIFVIIVSIQLIIYKISTGQLIVYSYQEEGFNFLDPHFIDILFSYKKGLFLYTPMYLLAMFGLIPFFNKRKFAVLSWLIFFVIITYVFSSWWMWYYGGSFSSRVYVEYIPLFMILFAVLLAEAKSKKWRIALLSLTFLLLVVCQVQTYQYRYYEIHWDEMTKEKYWDVFLMRNRLG
ncbi:hypothetical protein G3O08_02785 [Cryomorpha ignava]|uniref:Glycosyltransferase family 39 protein n=1 Tax=Cryomorpha ignava TaxID=101383 RepID=A0A7K3WLB4_9FLAO|nr:hypothetical protein [Cryomorpha ignava]NEN22427.1 hypothetical protein [Cryomorpha ignava]